MIIQVGGKFVCDHRWHIATVLIFLLLFFPFENSCIYCTTNVRHPQGIEIFLYIAAYNVQRTPHVLAESHIFPNSDANFEWKTTNLIFEKLISEEKFKFKFRLNEISNLNANIKGTKFIGFPNNVVQSSGVQGAHHSCQAIISIFYHLGMFTQKNYYEFRDFFLIVYIPSFAKNTIILPWRKKVRLSNYFKLNSLIQWR